MENVRLVLIQPPKPFEDAMHIRRIVFQKGQRISEKDDFDGNDDTATHIVVYHKEQPVGTGRLRKVNEDTVKIERVAVLEAMRGRGIGKLIMQTLDAHAASMGTQRATLDAQTHAKAFYESLGYQAEGEAFEEVGMPHIVMTKQFAS